MKSSTLRHSLLLLASAQLAGAEVDFRTQIQPIFENACIRCHSAEKVKGDLRLDTKAGFLRGGKSGPLINAKEYEKSELLRRIKLPRDHEEIMPQETEPLSGPHKNWLTDWVRTGAKWPDGVVLKLKKKEIPGLAETDFIPSKAPASLAEAAAVTDQILTKENQASKNPPTKSAAIIDDLSFLRRATVDLIGRIPTAEEIKQFESDRSADRREKLVDRLIAHSRFAERWTVFFADMIRVRSQQEGGPQLLAYVNRSVAEAKPYDQMVRELIATNGRPESAPAAGFALGDAANPMALAGATSQIFLGVRQKEFYDLAAFFGTIKRVEQGKNVKRIYTTEAEETAVKWPPEREQPPKRVGVAPKFPFELVNYTTKPNFIARLEDRRRPNTGALSAAAAKKALDELVDGIDVKQTLRDTKQDAAILAEAKAAAARAQDGRSIYTQSEERKKLAALITDPRNPYFARAFVNRVWAELVGRGFVEPLDNISAYNEIRHPQALQFLAQEFVASGYDLRSLVKTVMLTQAYQRGHLPAGAEVKELASAEENFTATRARRMLGEVLFDSVTVAGHLLSHKWPEGANVREVKRQVRIPLANAAMLAAAEDKSTNQPNMMMAMNKPGQAPAPYDLEKGASLDFDALLKPEKMGKDDDKFGDVLSESKKDLAMNKKMEDDAIEAQRQARIRLLRSGNAERFRLETVTAIVDDNPKFDTTLRMATPAPPSHFIRVFGQPARDNLGEFRDESPSLRQELMMLNGKATHEASRVGPLEPVYHLIAGPNANPAKAVELVYLEIFTRRPTTEELAEAREVISGGKTPADGLADLRWAMLNSHEFRYLP
ncbi:MAG: DUF1553 domain-containing protein [Proteobacteria bacterium]|nr:DUF1553 domain-containing protein [Pseudomonadota bacterium]